MTPRIRPLFAVALAAAFASPIAIADEPSKKDPGLKVGGEPPFVVVDFVAGPHKGHCGCPSVMIRNEEARGFVIWSRTADDAAMRLAAAAEVKVDGKKTHGYLVVFDTPEEKLAAQVKSGEWKNVTVGSSRHASQEEFAKRGFDSKVAYAVFLVDRKEIKTLWTLRADELTKEKADAILKEATAFLSR
ncbi:MAG TPA: hypothetical protein VKD71_08040 [Gemmataceae bacterium]|nr:hypothetical protein [Gemmataceae bacterium]